MAISTGCRFDVVKVDSATHALWGRRAPTQFISCNIVLARLILRPSVISIFLRSDLALGHLFIKLTILPVVRDNKIRKTRVNFNTKPLTYV